MYSAWSGPIGGRGISVNTSIDISKKSSATPLAGNQQPTAQPFFGLTAAATVLNGQLVATDPESATLAYSLVPTGGPAHGTVTIGASGAFIYTPNGSFSGYDHFYYSVTDGSTKPIVQEVVIGVSPQLPALPLALPTVANLTPIVRVRAKAITINSGWQAVSFPLEVSPQAQVGDVYRMIVKQEALDCDCNSYFKLDCFDIVIGACR